MLGSVETEDKEIVRWLTRLDAYRFKSEYPEDHYGWLTCVLALVAVAEGNAGVGCMLVQEDGDVIATGHNQVFYPYFRSDLHGEMAVMNKYEEMRLGISPGGLTIYSSLESCPMCVARLLEGGVGRICYLVRDELFGMVVGRDALPPKWNELAETKSFGTADCSADLSEAARGIFFINIEELFEVLKNL